MTEPLQSDVALVGGGIMNATLGRLIRTLIPDVTIRVFERLPSIAFESSQSMNNAGTGHAGNCELNYTPKEAKETQFQANLKKLIPSFGMDLINDPQLLKQIRARVDAVLGLEIAGAHEMKASGAT